MFKFDKVDRWAFGIVLDLYGWDTHLHIFMGPWEVEIGIRREQ